MEGTWSQTQTEHRVRVFCASEVHGRIRRPDHSSSHFGSRCRLVATWPCYHSSRKVQPDEGPDEPLSRWTHCGACGSARASPTWDYGRTRVPYSTPSAQWRLERSGGSGVLSSASNSWQVTDAQHGIRISLRRGKWGQVRLCGPLFWPLRQWDMTQFFFARVLRCSNQHSIGPAIFRCSLVGSS